VLDELPDALDAVRRHESLPGEHLSKVAVELVGEPEIGCRLRPKPGSLRPPDVLSRLGVHRPEDVLLRAAEVDHVRPARHLAVARRRHPRGGESTVGELDIEHAQLVEGEGQERSGCRPAIDPGLQQETHHLRPPSAQRASQDADSVPADDGPDEVADRSRAVADDGEDDLGVLGCLQE
jgi:hypothetical protein